MRIPLHSPARRVGLLVACVAAAAVYVGLAATEYLAAHFSRRPNLQALERAARLQPGNADYRYRVGRYLFLVQHEAQSAVPLFKAAVALNPHKARYWFDLAAAYQLLGDSDAQQDSLEHAIRADPKTPDVAWEAANLYLVRGETDKALAEFRTVLESDPSLAPSALQLCWRVRPDVDALLPLLPPNPQVYFAFLDVLMVRKETAATAKVWGQLAQLHQAVESRRVFGYIRYLLEQREVGQARMVWLQSATLCGLSAYQPSSENLVVNGDFSLDTLNGGFDWLYRKSPDVALALDPTQARVGNRSLSLVLDSGGMEDAGIRQLIPVQPGATYEFSAYFKAKDMDGAGGIRFAIQDAYGGPAYLRSDELSDADYWKQVSGAFTTARDAKLLVLRLQRSPAGSPIKGKLWIDGVRLVPKQQGGH